MKVEKYEPQIFKPERIVVKRSKPKVHMTLEKCRQCESRQIDFSTRSRYRSSLQRSQWRAKREEVMELDVSIGRPFPHGPNPHNNIQSMNQRPEVMASLTSSRSGASSQKVPPLSVVSHNWIADDELDGVLNFQKERKKVGDESRQCRLKRPPRGRVAPRLTIRNALQQYQFRLCD